MDGTRLGYCSIAAVSANPDAMAKTRTTACDASNSLQNDRIPDAGVQHRISSESQFGFSGKAPAPGTKGAKW
jgi:hypothetical protein